ncbi:MAG: hypothetical protein WCP06_12475 [Verrucomicrobiota bacterium]
MIYSLSLYTVGLVVGLLLIVSHAVALIHSKGTQRLLALFPRSKVFGGLLLTIAAIWAFLMIANIDLGEFTAWRRVILGVIVAAYFLTLRYVGEFLSVRALGMLFLLAAEPLLEAAFLRPEISRLLLTVLAYAWATAGLFWVGMPYILRDQIAWVSKNKLRWSLAALGGIVYGIVVVVCAVTQWS